MKMAQSRLNQAIKNVVTSSLAQLCILLLGFCVRTALVVGLGQYYLGLNSVMTSLIAIFSLAELGLGNAVAYSLYRPLAEGDTEKVEAYLSLYKKVYRSIGLVIAALAMLTFPFLNKLINAEVTPEVVTIYVLFTANTVISYLMFAYRGILMQANQDKYLVVLADLLFTIISSAGQIVCFVVISNYIIGLVCMVIAQICRGFMLLYFSKKKYGEYDFSSHSRLTRQESRDLLRNICAMAIGKFSDTANKNFSNVIISVFVGLVQSGIYSNYQMISSAINSFLSQVFGALTASVGNFNVSKETGEKEKLYYRLDFIAHWVYCTCCVCIWCSIDSFISSWIGKEYLLDSLCVSGIVANIMVVGLLHATVIFKDGCGVFFQGRYRPLATCILSIVLALCLIGPFGIAGAIWSAPLSRVFTALWFDPFLVHKFVFNDKPYKTYLRFCSNVIVTVLLMGVGDVFCSFVPEGGWLSFLSCVLVSLLVSQMGLFFIYLKHPDRVYLFNLIRKRVMRR